MMIRSIYVTVIFIIVNYPLLACDADFEETEPESMLESVANGVHSTVSAEIISISNKIDNFFVEERMEEEGSKSRLIISSFQSADTDLNVKQQFQFKGRLNFPKTQNRLRLVVESSIERDQLVEGEQVTGDTTAGTSQVEDYSTALQFIFTQSDKWQFSNKVGVRFRVPVDPFVRFRLRRSFFQNSWQFRIVETVAWYQSEGWGSTTNFDLERPVNQKLFFRESSRFNILNNDRDLLYDQSFSLFHTIRNKKIIVYSIGMNSQITDPIEVSKYFLNMKFRYNFFNKWAFFDIVPELAMEKEYDFKLLPRLSLQLDIVFGKV